MDHIWAAAKDRGYGGAYAVMGGRGRGVGGRTALPEISSNVPFVGRTADGDDVVEINGKEMV